MISRRYDSHLGPLRSSFNLLLDHLSCWLNLLNSVLMNKCSSLKHSGVDERSTVNIRGSKSQEATQVKKLPYTLQFTSRNGTFIQRLYSFYSNYLLTSIKISIFNKERTFLSLRGFTQIPILKTLETESNTFVIR